MPPATNEQAIREQLQRILVSPGFLHSERLRRFLTHCVDAALAGRLDDLKEYTIGVAAFDRPKHYNPADDPIVRVEARRLRLKLDEYYNSHGAADRVVIQLPKGGYMPAFEVRAGPAKPNRRLWMVMGAVALGSVAAVWWFLERRPAPRELRLAPVTFDRGLTTDPALTPDGSLLVYASDRAINGGLDIWIQPLKETGTGAAARQLTNDEVEDSQPAISPDGSTVAFRSERRPPGLYILPAGGGQPKLLAPDGRNPQFSPDGRSIAYWVGAPGGDALPPAGKTYIIPSSGGAPRPLAANLTSTACPVWSPDGRNVLLEAMESPADPLDLWVVTPGGEQLVRTGIARVLDPAQLKFSMRECSLAWQDRSIVFSAASGTTENLWRLPVSSDARPRGRLAHVTLGSADEARPAATPTGVIAFVSRTQTLNVWRMPVEHSEQLARLTQGTANISFPHAAGDRLAFLSKKSGPAGLWLKDLHSGTEMQITNAPVEPRYPQLCPGGQTVVYSDGPNAFAATDRSPSSRLLCNGCARVWQCNEDALFYLPAGAAHPNAIYQFPLPAGPGVPLLVSSQYDLANAQKNADGWVVFHAITGTAQRQIFVARYRRGKSIPREEWIAVTDGTNTDRNAVWNERGDTLYFLSERCGFRCVWSQRLDVSTKQPIGPPAAVRHFHSARQDLSSIGDSGAIGLSYNAGNIYFTMAEQTGNIWLARPAQ